MQPHCVSSGTVYIYIYLLILSCKLHRGPAFYLIPLRIPTKFLDAFILHRSQIPQHISKIGLKCTILHVQVVCLFIFTNHHFVLPHSYTGKYYLWIKLIIIICPQWDCHPFCINLHRQCSFISLCICIRDTCNLLMCLDRWWQRSCLFNKIFASQHNVTRWL